MSELAGLFHPAAVRATSFRVFPSQESRTPLEAASSPAVIHQVPRCDSQRLITCGFPDAHGCPRLPGSPTDYGFPFDEVRRPHFPFTLGTGRRITTSPNFTHFEALILLRVRSRQLGLPLASGRSSPGFMPLWSFLLPHLGPSTRPDHKDLNMSSSRRTRTRLKGPCDPSRRVRPHQAPKHSTQPRRRFSAPFEADPHRLSTAPLLPWP